MKRIAVLVSGSGSNLQALIDAQLQNQLGNGKIVGVLSNKANAYALTRAKHANIDTAIISHQDFPTRESFDQQMHQQLLDWDIDLVVLAGFMRILSSDFVSQWQGRMLNIHPSLLPHYKGMHTHQRVLNTGDRFHGCTVHFVTAELDAGQAIIQAVLEVRHSDTVESLATRIHPLEHQIYSQAVQWFCNEQLIWCENQAYFQNKPLQESLKVYYFD